MEESPHGKQNEDAKARSDNNTVIDLVGGSDDTDDEDYNNDCSGNNRRGVIPFTKLAKKRRMVGGKSLEENHDADVIDLVADNPSFANNTNNNNSNTIDSFSTTISRHDGRAAKSTKKRPRDTASRSSNSIRTSTKSRREGPTVATAIDVEIVDLMDSCDDDPVLGNTARGTKNCSSNDKDNGNGSIHKSKRTSNHNLTALEPGDNAILNYGISERIYAISNSNSMNGCSRKKKNSCWTCLGPNGKAAVDMGTPCGPAHIQQSDDWSCGYRNYQMMLSALLPKLRESRPQHSVFQKIPRRLPPIPINLPSVRRIQSSMEDAWNEGFDIDGANHYHRRIAGKSGTMAKIGAMEVANLCWYHGIDAVVIQFMKCFESRSLLPYFFLAYFTQISIIAATNNTSVGVNNEELDEEASLLATRMLSKATRLSKLPVLSSIESIILQMVPAGGVNSISTGRNPVTVSTLLPVYLQWEGHSVTVIGIEVLFGDQKNNDSSSLSPSFLVLDPLKESQNLQSDLRCHNNPQQQQQQTLPASVKLPWEKISEKDLQIIVCTGRSMPYSERQLCKSSDSSSSGSTDRLPLRGRVLTAAEDAVRDRRYQFS